MPVYNQERYLGAAVGSILGQTFRDFELLIVDDGSTDGTKRLLGELSDPRIRVIHAPHRGVRSAFELGIREARGQWVARMDSDDLSHPERLGREVTFLQAHPECVFVMTLHGVITPNDRYLAPRSTFDWSYLEPGDLTRNAFLTADASAMFDRETALHVGLLDPDFEHERPLFYRLLRKGRGGVLGKPLYFARFLLGSHSKSDRIRQLSTALDIKKRYDPNGHAQLGPKAMIRSREQEDVRIARHAVDYYLLAGDVAAARAAAWRAWRALPAQRGAVKLMLKALLRRRALSAGEALPADGAWQPAARPW